MFGIRFARRMTAIALVTALAACSGAPDNGATAVGDVEPAGPVATVDGGNLAGATSQHDSSVRVFRGIPFAAPPTGELRWRPPQPAPPWEGTLDATEFSPACMQLNREAGSFYGPGAAEMSENCLYLNVWTAANDGESRPVMLWLHGGGLRNGTASDPRFEGTALAARGVVVVTTNYRLGPFGYLAHPLLSAEDEHDSSGNYGLLDQIAALQWVRDNIAAFGGDPNRVTIFGQSAGASSVSYLMVSPLSKDLFHRAIAHSGGRFRGTASLRQDSLEGESAETVGEEFIDGLLSNAAVRIAQLGEELPLDLETIRSFEAEEILELLQSSGAGFRSSANVDGWALTESVYDAFAGGRQHDVPFVAGWTADEGTTLAPGTAPADLAAYRQWRSETFGAAAGQHAELYPVSDDAGVARAFYQSYADGRFGWSVWTGARLMKTVSSPSYLYYFTRVPPGENSSALGAYHSVDVAYTFTNFDLSPDPVADRDYDDVDRSLGDRVASYWVSFAETGDPNRDGQPEWPAYTEAEGATMVFGDAPAVENGARQQQLELFDAIQKRRRAGS